MRPGAGGGIFDLADKPGIISKCQRLPQAKEFRADITMSEP